LSLTLTPSILKTAAFFDFFPKLFNKSGENQKGDGLFCFDIRQENGD